MAIEHTRHQSDIAQLFYRFRLVGALELLPLADFDDAVPLDNHNASLIRSENADGKTRLARIAIDIVKSGGRLRSEVMNECVFWNREFELVE